MHELPVEKIDAHAGDGHRWQLLAIVPQQPQMRLLWMPAMGVAAKHYLPFAQALADRGVAVFIHDWRGNGSSSLRPARDVDWGYREVLMDDLPATEAAVRQRLDGLPRVLGGHSLGGQLACCHLGLAPDSASQLWLVASGSPYWRAFPLRSRWWLPMAYRFLPWLADRRGFLPGLSDGTRLGPLFTDPAHFDVESQWLAEVPAGSLIFFDSHVVHGSEPNRSDRARRAMVVTYQPPGHAMFKVEGTREFSLGA